MTKAVYNILENNKDYILLQDVGEKHDRSLTNDMEKVIVDLFLSGKLKEGKELYYIDSLYSYTQVIYETYNRGWIEKGDVHIRSWEYAGENYAEFQEYRLMKVLAHG